MDNANIEGVKIILKAQGLPGAVAVVDGLKDENALLKECIRSLIAEPIKSTKLISRKCKITEPMNATFLKGQVLDAIKLCK